MKSGILQLSGESGGGQLLRTALTLSMVTGRAFRMTGIRGKRPKPGLMRQHLTCVKAAAAVCNGVTDGAELGSAELVFHPGQVKAGDYRFAIGSGGSTSLVFQTLLPALLHANAPSTLRIEGGTHNPMAPPYEFIAECYLPVLVAMGVQTTVTLERHGFMQAGGGLLAATIQPVKKWKKLKLLERGERLGSIARVVHAHLHRDIAQRQFSTAASLLGWKAEDFELRYANDSTGPGSALLLGAQFANVTEISSAIAQIGKSAEGIATHAASLLRHYLNATAPVGVHLADQLLLPMALAGRGVFRTVKLSEHTRTNLQMIETFLPLQFAVKELDGGAVEMAL